MALRCSPSTDAGPQAYRLGRMLALQFHPEVSTEIIHRWGKDAAADADAYGVDLEEVYRQSEQLAEQNRQRCYALVDAFLDRSPFRPEVALPNVSLADT